MEEGAKEEGRKKGPERWQVGSTLDLHVAELGSIPVISPRQK